MKFKQYIQSEINQKEVEPSHDAFDRIQARLKNQPEIVVEKSTTKKWWAVAAAVVGLAVCTTVYFSMERENHQPEIVNQENNSTIEKSSDSKVKEQTSTEILNQIEAQQEPKITNSKPTSTPFTESVSEEKEQMVSNQNQESKVVEETQSQTIQKPALATGLKQAPVQMATNLDTVKVKKKKGNYVDPNMLLYSIENKEALKETQKEKTRVAVIDLNK